MWAALQRERTKMNLSIQKARRVSDLQQQVVNVLERVLSLNGRSARFTSDTALLGAIPELDSMAVIGVISSLEERFEIEVADDDIDGATFATVGSLTKFIQSKLTEQAG
jgi:acyl carrier protein